MAHQNDTTAAIASAVSAALKARGIKLEDVVDATGISYGTLWRRLNGVGKAFDLDELALIARLLDMDLGALITYGEATQVPA